MCILLSKYIVFILFHTQTAYVHFVEMKNSNKIHYLKHNINNNQKMMLDYY
jgi:hypothetical protein